VATLAVEGDELHLQLSTWEKIGAFHSDIRVPTDSVAAVDVATVPRSTVRGMRSPGTGLPGVVALGTWRYRGGPDFIAVYRNRPSVVVTLRNQPFTRLIVSVDDPDAVAAEIRRAIPSAAA